MFCWHDTLLHFCSSYFCLQSALLWSQGWWRHRVSGAHAHFVLLVFICTACKKKKEILLCILNGENILQSSQIEGGLLLAEPAINYGSILHFHRRASKSAWTAGQGGTWQQYLPIFDFLNGFSCACTIDQSPNIMSVYPEGGTEVDWFYPTSQNELILKDSTFRLRDSWTVCVCWFVSVCDNVLCTALARLLADANVRFRR